MSVNRLSRVLPAAAFAAAVGLSLLPTSAQASPTSASAIIAPTFVDVSYVADGNPRHTLNIYPAAAGARVPIVVSVPGGGWTHESNLGNHITQVNSSLNKDGFVVFSPNYRWATAAQDGVPMQSNDVTSALLWVQAHGAEYGGDVTDINIIGGSAGAQLSTLSAEIANARYPGLVAGVIEMSGVMNWFDFRTTGTSGGQPGAETYLGCLLAECTDTELRQPSPELRLSSHSAKHMLVNGTVELFPADEAINMNGALLAAGISSQLILVAGDAHGFALFPFVEPQVVAFINS